MLSELKSATSSSQSGRNRRGISISNFIFRTPSSVDAEKYAPVQIDRIQDASTVRRIMALSQKILQCTGWDVDHVSAVLNSEIATLVNCQSAEILCRHVSKEDDNIPADVLLGIAGHVFTNGKSVMLNSTHDIESHEAYTNEVDIDLSSILCVPLFCSGSDNVYVLGVIKAINSHAGCFTKDHLDSLLLLADYIGYILSINKQLESRTKLAITGIEQHNQSVAILEVARALSSQTTLPGIVSLVTHKVQALLRTERCTMFLVDRAANELIVWKDGSHGNKLTFLDWIRGKRPAPDLPFQSDMNEIRMPIDKGIAGYVVTTGDKLKVLDAHLDARFNPEMDRLTGFKSRDILCMPMKTSAGIIVGAIQAINKDPRFGTFTEADEDLLETFAAHTAIAIENSSLLSDIKKSLAQSDAILEVTKALSSELQLVPLVQIIVEKVQKLMNVERCTVFICDHSKNELYTRSSMSYGDGLRLPINNETEDIIRIPMNRGIAGHVAITGQTLIIPDAYADARFNQKMDLETGYRTRNILCMSIQDHKKEIVGVVQAINKRHGLGFNDDDVKQLGAFSAQAAVAITNSRLYQETERALNQALRQVRNLKFMLNVTKNLSSELQTSSLMFQMQSQLNDLLKADHCFFFMVEAEKGYMYRLEGGNESDRLSLDQGISGWVARTAQTVKIQNDAQTDDRYESIIDSNGAPCESILCMPIVARDEVTGDNQVYGLISVQDETDKGGFGKEEEALLTVFCAQAAVALSNSRKFIRVMDDATCKQDEIAAEYLQRHRGMQLGGHEIDRYAYSVNEIRLSRRIGTGSYGEVWLAKARGEIVAVKKIFIKNLKGEQIDSFCSEASLMCQLKHPNVIEFKGAVTQPPDLCIVTEFCARGSLAHLLADQTFVATNRIILKFIKDIASGMHYLHTSNPVILHRDLKSDNLLVDRNWNVKVADFGLTRFMDDKKKMTQVGTPIWMSPEVCSGEQYTEKADVYAFGIIMWEILMRQEPYEDKEMMQIVLEVVNNGLRPHVTDELRAHPLYPLLTDCWHQLPDRRPNFKAILERLDNPDFIRLMDNDDPVVCSSPSKNPSWQIYFNLSLMQLAIKEGTVKAHLSKSLSSQDSIG